jgi:hypothetical protein
MENSTLVKGTGLKTTRDFVLNNYPEKYSVWFESLPESSKKYFNDAIISSQWYPFKEGYIDPINCIISTFFNGDAKTGGERLGIYSAEVALRGVYKAFLLVASPQYLMKRAKSMISAYYQPCEVLVTELEKNRVRFSIASLDGITLAFEYRAGGWVKRALELAYCRNVNYTIEAHLSKGDPSTDIILTWD